MILLYRSKKEKANTPQRALAFSIAFTAHIRLLKNHGGSLYHSSGRAENQLRGADLIGHRRFLFQIIQQLGGGFTAAAEGILPDSGQRRIGEARPGDTV